MSDLWNDIDQMERAVFRGLELTTRLLNAGTHEERAQIADAHPVLVLDDLLTGADGAYCARNTLAVMEGEADAQDVDEVERPDITTGGERR